MTPQKTNWLGFFSLLPGLAMVFLDQTILPVALPTIQKEFGAGNVALNWTVNAYLLALALFTLAGGKLSDRIGHRKALISGVALFAISSALCGLSQNSGMLIVTRFVQGLGACLYFPAQTALMNRVAAAHERGRIIGYNASIGSVFLMLGPLIGGYLTEWASWRWIFWVNVPIALTGILMARAFLPNPEPLPAKIDKKGFFYFLLCSGPLVTAIMQAGDWGWASPEILLLFLVALIALIFLVRREKRAAHPFLELQLFKHPIFSAINLNISIAQFIMMITVFRAIYFQTTLDYTPSQAGLLTFVSTMPVLFLSTLGGYLSDKVSPKLPISLGYLFLIFSCLWFGWFSTPGLVGLLIPLVTFGMGLPFIFTPSYSSAMGSVPPQKLGVAFGIVGTLRYSAATLGLALIALFISSVEQKTHSAQPQVSAFSAVHFALGALLIATFLLVLIFYRRKSAHHLPEAPAEGWD